MSLTLSFDDGPHSVQKASVLWLRLRLVMNELHLHRFHGTHYQNSLRDSSPEATQKGAPLR